MKRCQTAMMSGGALVGQLHKRISTGVRDPLTATVLALETRGADGRRELAILVSADLIMIPPDTVFQAECGTAAQASKSLEKFSPLVDRDEDSVPTGQPT